MIININKSYIFAILAYTLVSGCALLILLSPWPIVAKLLILPIVLHQGYLQVQCNALLRSMKSIVALELKQAGMEIYLRADPSKSVLCRVVHSHVSKHLVAVRLAETIGRQQHDLFIVRSMCSNEDFRVLKRYLLSQTEAVAS
jgi:hypothetical protein